MTQNTISYHARKDLNLATGRPRQMVRIRCLCHSSDIAAATLPVVSTASKIKFAVCLNLGFSVSRMMASPKRDYLLLQEMGADSHYFFHRKEHTRSVLNTSASTCAAAESTSQSQSEKSSRSGALTALKDSPETSGTCTVASR